MDFQKFPLIPFILYIGPDVLMPLASVLAAVVGFLLMFASGAVLFTAFATSAYANVFFRIKRTRAHGGCLGAKSR